MPNKAGDSYWFDYQESPGVNRKTKLTETYVEDEGSAIGRQFRGAHDSDWFVVRQGETQENGPYDILTYLGHDGRTWYATTTCSVSPLADTIDVKFNTWHDDGADKKDSEWIGIVDWDGKHWKVFVHEVITPKGQPKFTLDDNF